MAEDLHKRLRQEEHPQGHLEDRPLQALEELRERTPRALPLPGH